jgi:hypothetical protein
MSTNHDTHEGHAHQHGSQCGHVAIRHQDHTDYLHDGHMHHLHNDHVDEHALAVDSLNPADCTPSHACGEHDKTHVHGENCGHPRVPHGDHFDFLVGAHLHHPHTGHCDDHGAVNLG